MTGKPPVVKFPTFGVGITSKTIVRILVLRRSHRFLKLSILIEDVEVVVLVGVVAVSFDEESGL